MEKLEILIKDGQAYLCSDKITIADLVMFSHFWKLIYNKEAETPKDEFLSIAVKYPKVNGWLY